MPPITQWRGDFRPEERNWEISMAERVHGLHHIGITVPNLKEAIAFFEAVFGAVDVFHTGPFNVDDHFMARKLGAAAHSRIRDLVFLRCGAGASIELFEYAGEDPNPPGSAIPKSAARICASRSKMSSPPPNG
jgi:catechol 2,3-dioxygenase-like lactoylglutathione lyase family enzyme